MAPACLSPWKARRSAGQGALRGHFKALRSALGGVALLTVHGGAGSSPAAMGTARRARRTRSTSAPDSMPSGSHPSPSKNRNSCRKAERAGVVVGEETTAEAARSIPRAVRGGDLGLGLRRAALSPRAVRGACGLWGGGAVAGAARGACGGRSAPSAGFRGRPLLERRDGPGAPGRGAEQRDHPRSHPVRLRARALLLRLRRERRAHGRRALQDELRRRAARRSGASRSHRAPTAWRASCWPCVPGAAREPPRSAGPATREAPPGRGLHLGQDCRDGGDPLAGPAPAGSRCRNRQQCCAPLRRNGLVA